MTVGAASAVERVFDITELLESILIKLPSKDLLHSQRTCKAWKDTVVGSDHIQKALGFKATSVCDRNSIAVNIDDLYYIQYGEYSVQVVPVMPPTLSRANSAEEYLTEIFTNSKFTLNPLIHTFISPSASTSGAEFLGYKPEMVDVDLRNSSALASAYIAQPPPTVARFKPFYNRTTLTEPKVIIREGGVTLGDLLNEIHLISGKKYYFSHLFVGS